LAEIAGATTLVTNQWQHISGTYDGTNMTVYLNGVQDGQMAQTGAIDYGTSEDLIFGSDGPALNTESFTGLMDDIRIYGRCLSSNEIAAIYNGGTGTEQE
jgi:hypothetical protein